MAQLEIMQPDVDWRAFARRIRQLRIERGLTQSALAGDRYTAPYISTIEAGKRRPSGDAVRHLAERLGVSEGELLTGLRPNEEAEMVLEIQKARSTLAEGDSTTARTIE